MRMPSRGRGAGLRFNLTPMIDVVFNLIIFFLAASHLARSETVEEVRLPEARLGQQEETEARKRLTVTISADGVFYVGSKSYELAQLAVLIQSEQQQGGDVAAASDLEVRIRTDRRVPYRLIEPILTYCAQAGVTKVKFAVIPES